MQSNYNNDDTFLARWMAGELSDEVLRAFKETEAYKEFQKIAEESQALETPMWKSKDSSWKDFKAETAGAQKSTAGKVIKLKRRQWLSFTIVAASLLLFGFIFLFQSNALKKISTSIAEKKTAQLPDGSIVTLNANTRINYDENNFATERILDLQGEAYFEVAPGSNFIVETTNGSVKVVGTVFNVRSRKSKLDVSCYSGKVAIFFDDESDFSLLKANEQIIAINGIIKTQRIAVAQSTVPQWTQGYSKFTNVNIMEVVEELKRQFEVAIIYPNEFSELEGYSGGFPHDDIESALKIVLPAIGYRFKIDGKEVVIYK